MLESFKSKRALLRPGEQRKFLMRVEEILGLSKVATLSNCTERTVRDWRREKFRIPAEALTTLASEASVPIPTHRLVEMYAHVSEAGKKGYTATVSAHGRIPKNEQVRRQRWEEWWDKTGRFGKNPALTPLPIRKPKRSEELAEFIGIMMGDGGLSRYQVIVSLHQIDDADFSRYVSRQFEKLFGVVPSVYDREDAHLRSIVVSRVELVRYLHSLGLPMGNKIRQQFDIPSWIKKEERFMIACIRGLVDTDGCIFTHRYEVKHKRYSYKKLSFTTASRPLLSTVHTALKALGMNPRIGSRKDVRLDSRTDMERYFIRIGSNNPKHLRRYHF